MNTPNTPRAPNDPTETSAQIVPLILSWLFVGVPALWGVAQVVKKSLALFR